MADFTDSNPYKDEGTDVDAISGRQDTDREGGDTSRVNRMPRTDIETDVETTHNVETDVDVTSDVGTDVDVGTSRDGNIMGKKGNVEKTMPDRGAVKVSTGQTSAVRPGPEPVSVESDSYNMEHKRRGYALLINQERFSADLQRQGYTKRTGTAVDERNISRKLKELGFDVTIFPDLTANHIKNMCAKMADKDHSDCDCFVFVILSHGEEGVVYGTDKEVEIKELASYFRGDRCPTLIGKPKLFIIQACRGNQTDPGVKVNVTDALKEASDDKTEVRKDVLTIKLPVEADFLFAYSTVPGYYSWRNGANGSWFIQALCAVLEKHLEKGIEIRKLLTLVNRQVAQNFQSSNPDNEDFHRMKQVPCISSMLTKDLYLCKKKRKR
ncbi:CASP1-like protein [Mya arenaria]|uniref:CASP1-like protein n=1 Tax=Mya arenaria TaxID=6604 RepID=A0ABY7FFH1_MYAAR|nr:caspase-3-like [Mya arenaria]WAR20930.1 CASP1-like protein [Mya arenaria]